MTSPLQLSKANMSSTMKTLFDQVRKVYPNHKLKTRQETTELTKEPGEDDNTTDD